MVKIDDSADFEKAKTALKYFKIDDKECRALPFDRDLLGVARTKIAD